MKLILKGEAFKLYMLKTEDASDGIKAIAKDLTPTDKFDQLVEELLGKLRTSRSKFDSDLDFLIEVLDLDFIKKSNLFRGTSRTLDEAKRIHAQEILSYVKAKDWQKIVKEIRYFQMNKGVGGDITFTRNQEEAILFKKADLENYVTLSFCDIHAPIDLTKVENVFFVYLFCKVLN